MSKKTNEGKHFPAMDIPEPFAFKVRTELRRQPTGKLQEAYKALQRGEATGLDILDRSRDHAISACKEILWERGKWHPEA